MRRDAAMSMILAVGGVFVAGRAVPHASAQQFDAPRADPGYAAAPLPLAASEFQPPRPAVAAQVFDPSDPLSVYSELSVEVFVELVVSSHPSTTAALAAWRAAAARYPQVVALDDPMLDYMTAPATIGSNDVDYAFAVQARQKVPWFGKRKLRGDAARHEARATYHDSLDVRLELVEAATAAFYEYYTAVRRRELVATNRRAMEQFRAAALDRYQTGLVTQQDVLLADVELAETERREVELDRTVRVALARVNTLLLRFPDAPMPPLAERIRAPHGTLDVEMLREMAVAGRPDVAAATSRVRAEQSNVALAHREYRPDLELVGRYDTMWLPQERMVGQIGVTLNVPIQRARRDAAVRQATATTVEKRAEFDRLVYQVRFQVHEAYERVNESRRVVRLFEEKLLPSARLSVEGGAAAYETGKLDFLRLVEAQRKLIDLETERVAVIGEYQVRWAELERAVGGPIPEVSTAESVPNER